MSNVGDIDRILAEYGTPEVELESWELPYFNAKVALEDGRRFRVKGDQQRDLRRAADMVDMNADQLGFVTATSWACLVRTGRIADDWPTFSGLCMFVEAETATTVDPTGTGGAP